MGHPIKKSLLTVLSGYFKPSDISGCQLWVDAADTATITESSGSVSQWNDKSGNENHATQGTGSLQPTTGVTTQNGKNVLDFDNTEAMDLPSALYSIPNGPNTVFTVSARTAEEGATDTVVSIGEDGVSNNWFVLYSPVSGSMSFRSNSAASGGATSSSNINTNFQYTTSVRSGTNVSISVNSVNEGTNTDGTDYAGADVARIGQAASGTLRLDGSIAEIIIYNRELSSREIAAVENYLSNKWLGFQIPTDVGNCQLWLDASDTDTITESSDLVSQWDDKSGNGYHATQGTGSEQPLTNTTTENGLNVLDFDGNDNMDLAAGTFPIPEGSSTIFIVAKRTSEDASLDGLYAFLDGATTKNLAFYGSTSGQVSYRSNEAGSGTVNSTGNTNTDFNVFRFRRDGITNAIAVNGGSEDTSAIGSDITGIDSAFIGSTGTFDLTGSIAEFIAYDRSLEASEITNIENYLIAKWGI